MTASTPDTPRLTSLSHGGGCGCKIAPGVLTDLLARSSVPPQLFPDLLVGTETADDAAVYRINEHQAIVATTDFFMPIVDDPYDFGRIAATNALSDVYAMGGQPIMALAVVGMPINVLPHDVIARILEGGQSVCRDAGVPLAGGHSIDSVEPIYGLVAIGTVDPKDLKRNSGAQAGDVLILGKPLGVGIYSAALKKGQLDESDYATMIDATTRLNRPGPELARLARGSGLTASINGRAVPFLKDVIELASAGIRTGASGRNWASYGADVDMAPDAPPFLQDLLTDPQTAGGLLVACAPEAANDVLKCFNRFGFAQATAIGHLEAGPGRVQVR